MSSDPKIYCANFDKIQRTAEQCIRGRRDDLASLGWAVLRWAPRLHLTTTGKKH